MVIDPTIDLVLSATHVLCSSLRSVTVTTDKKGSEQGIWVGRKQVQLAVLSCLPDYLYPSYMWRVAWSDDV